MCRLFSLKFRIWWLSDIKYWDYIEEYENNWSSYVLLQVFLINNSLRHKQENYVWCFSVQVLVKYSMQLGYIVQYIALCIILWYLEWKHPVYSWTNFTAYNETGLYENENYVRHVSWRSLWFQISSVKLLLAICFVLKFPFVLIFFYLAFFYHLVVLPMKHVMSCVLS